MMSQHCIKSQIELLTFNQPMDVSTDAIAMVIITCWRHHYYNQLTHARKARTRARTHMNIVSYSFLLLLMPFYTNGPFCTIGQTHLRVRKFGLRWTLKWALFITQILTHLSYINPKWISTIYNLCMGHQQTNRCFWWKHILKCWHPSIVYKTFDIRINYTHELG